MTLIPCNILTKLSIYLFFVNNRLSISWLHSPQGAGVYNLSVSDLMIPGEHKWDDANIELLFSDETHILWSTWWT